MPDTNARRWLSAAFGAALCALWPVLAGAATESTPGAPPIDPELVEKIRKSNAECISCHTQEALKNPPRADLDLKKLAEALMDPAAFDNSNHAGMECKACHGQGYAVFPHREGARKLISACSECHAVKSMRIEQQYAKSVHAQHLKDQFTCQTCHDPHVYKVAAKLGSPEQIVRQDNQMCFDCHNSDLRFAEFGEKLTPPKRRPDIDTIHDWLPNARVHWSAVRCVECHTPVITMKTLALSHEIVNKERAERDCVACHSRDTALKTRLYRHLASEEREKLGFANSVILGNSYVVGASRNAYVDMAALVLLALTLGGIAGHGLIRVLIGLTRRGRGK